ncbi:MAG: hypothetical protein K0S12_868, partial [Bacteroidetes bacterium]|nr:hypothetical protein [Bacteroidota bacterium]
TLFWVFSACKKESPAKAETPAPVSTSLADGMGSTTTVSGYLYSSLNTSFSWSGNSFFYAAFGDPARKLLGTYDHYNDFTIFGGSNNFGNIDVGQVTFANSYTLFKNLFNPSVNYTGNTNLFTPTTNNWSIEGNGTFKPFNINISRGYPSLANTFTLSPVSRTNAYTIDLTALASNYDSVIVEISNNGSSSFGNPRRRLGNAGTVTFNTSELSNLYTSSSGQIKICVFNYSNITIEDKRYIFELAKKNTQNIVINP